MSSLTLAQIDEVRSIARLEALRAAAFSVASESLDGEAVTFTVTMHIEGDELEGSIALSDRVGRVLSAGPL